MKNRYLFLFTISPVQSFIAQARKAQDLFAGSKLLTDLTRYAIEELTESLGDKVEIILPSKWGKQYDAALPNRILAEVDCDNNQAIMIGNTIETKLRDYFKSIADEVFINNAEFQYKPISFDWQIENHLDIYWLFENIENSSYKSAYNKIISNLGALKNIRFFKQLPNDECGRKDNLNGELDALFFNEKYRKPAFTKKSIQVNKPDNLLSKGEGLSAISFSKRFYKYDKNKTFQSTAEIAQLDIKSIINQSQNIKLFKSIIKDEFDYQLLYRDNLNKHYFEKHQIDFPADDLTLMEIHKGFLNDLKKVGKIQKKYYAILRFDGDNMGKWLSGDLIINNKVNNFNLKEFQKYFSELLSDFAKNSEIYINDNDYGKTVYAGGDDFLALINLNDIFDIVSEIRSKFDKEVSMKLKQKYSFINESVNLSAGIVIAHYRHPLGDVIMNSKKMESLAKSIKGKNSVAISVLKHSGENTKAVIKWGDSCDNLLLIGKILNSLQNKEVSPSFINNLNNIFKIYTEENEQDKIYDLFILELRTFIRRAKLPNVIDDKIEVLIKNITLLYNTSKLVDLLNILRIIDFIYRKV